MIIILIRTILTASVLIYISKRDIETREISNQSVIAIAVISVISRGAELISNASLENELFDNIVKDIKIEEIIINALIITLLLLSVILTERIKSKEIVGGGDIKLIAALSLQLSPEKLLLLLLISSTLLATAILSMFILSSLSLSKEALNKALDIKNATLPFAPFITAAYLAIFLLHPGICRACRC